MRRWWLVAKEDEVDICLKDPGYEVDLHVVTKLETLVQIGRGDTSLSETRRDKPITVYGPACRPGWVSVLLPTSNRRRRAMSVRP